ncbi:MAG TPA: PhzF family phenazine biosynthesis protein [Alphaproteobacteria bacterium]|nr:PhzF family phenazine biosynthesis protein [Alphaproteobacteria bacterium]
METGAIPIYQVDAFTDRVFAGNPAAVCPLDAWIDAGVMQAIATENNLSETAFFVPDGQGSADFAIRWFTPVDEIDLAGHPTLATVHVIFSVLEPARDAVTFSTRLGDTLLVTRNGDRLTMDFPARPPEPNDALGDVAAALGAEPAEVLAARDGLAVFASEAEVAALAPDMAAVAALDCMGLIATAPGEQCDFVSRFFAPKMGVPEDPVTGSAHCTLIPYWGGRLGKTEMLARQISARGGTIHCGHDGARVRIGGGAVTYMTGAINL